MSWEDQGRQYHAWFGHGTGPGPLGSAADPNPQQVPAMIAANAATSLSGGLQANYQRSLDNGWTDKLARAIPIWAASSGLDPASFRRLLAGPALGAAGAESLQKMAQLAAKVTNPASIAAASQQLADIIKGGGENWRYQLGYAHSQAVYAAVNGLVTDAPPAKSAAPKAGGPPIQLAATGDLRCDGFKAGCQRGGSYGTTGMYRLFNKNLCLNCAVKSYGIEDETAAEKTRILTPYVIK